MRLKLIYCFVFLSVSITAFPIGIIKNEKSEDLVVGNLTGVVTDKADGKPIPGVLISIPDLKMGTVTDLDGRYTITRLPKGNYLVQISYLGYTTLNKTFNGAKTTVLDVQLISASIETGEVIVTGVSKATEIRRNPIPMVAISKTFIEQHSASGNVIDEIAGLPGVSAVTTGPNISKPFIRGLGYNRVITLQDGIRQEGQQWGDEHGIEVDQNSIDRVEIIKGPASLSFGSDAIGGVVNLISPNPVPEGQTLGSFTSIYGTNNGLLNESLRLQGNQNGVVWGTVLSGKEAKDYQNHHDGRVYATNFQEKDARVMIGLNKTWGYSYLNASVFDDMQAIPDGSRDSLRRFTKQITDADVYRPVVPGSELNSYEIPSLHQHVQLYRIYDNSSFTLGTGNLIVNLGYQFSHRKEFTHPTESDIPGLNLQLQTYTYDFKYNFNLAKDYETTFGVNGMYQLNTLGYSTDFPIPAYHQFDVGPFFVIKKTFGKLDLSAGARYDTRSFHGKAAYIDTTSTFYPTLYTGSNPSIAPNVIPQFGALNKNFSGTSGSLGATYIVSNQFLVKGNIARGFRAPSIAELTANGPDPGSKIYHIGNSNFKPEFSMQEDIGVSINLPTISVNIDLFNNNIQNYIYQQQVLNPDGTPQREAAFPLYNVFTYTQSKARINGGEISVDIHPVSWLHFENEASLTYGTNLGNGGHVPDSLKFLPFIPPLHTHSELRGSINKGFGAIRNVYGFLGFDFFGEQNRFFSAYGTETRTAGYHLLSAGFGGDLVNSTGKTILKLFVEGTNLANVNYQSNMSRLKYFDNPVVPSSVRPGIYNMGRNISFKVVVPFDLSQHHKPVSES